MSRWLSSLLPLLILTLAVGLRYGDPGAIERLRLAAFDEYQRLAPRVWEDADVRIVDIDDESLKRLGQWPWPRTQVATLVERLGDAGAAAIAFDVLFAEPDRTSPARLLPDWAKLANDPSLAELANRLPDHDALLAAAIADAPVVAAFQMTGDDAAPRRPAIKGSIAVGGDDPRPSLPSFRSAVPSLAALEAAATGVGSINSMTDADGINRRVPLFLRLRGGTSVTDEVYPSLAAEALRVAQGARTYLLKVSGASGTTAFGEHTGIAEVKIGQFVVPTDDRGRLWLRDTGPIAQRFIPAWEILSPGFDVERIEGKIVLIGTSAAALKDLRATPLNPVAAGVEIHAQILEQMILGIFLERPDWTFGAEITALLLLGLVLVLLLPRWGAGWCAIVAVGGIALVCLGSWLAFLKLGLLVDPIYPSLAILLLYLAQSFLLYLRTEAERRRVRSAFAHYMSPVMVERLARDPASLKLGGEVREMTILFCDIRGFTSISESLDAESLTRFLNRYLTPMTEIIMSHGGTIDKYIGDAIMAFWNAPVDDSDHAVNAARAALAMIERLKDLNREWREEAERDGRPFKQVSIGIGLNTGSCSVGNMGSDQRFDYSVLGDTVNLASRLEGQSKTYGVPIIVGETTREQIEGFACLELDSIRVVGKGQAARIHALLGDEAAAVAPWFHLTGLAQQQMLAAYRQRDWVAAAEAVERVRQTAAGRMDGPCALYEARFGVLIKQPPQANWDGVFQATEK